MSDVCQHCEGTLQIDAKTGKTIPHLNCIPDSSIFLHANTEAQLLKHRTLLKRNRLENEERARVYLEEEAEKSAKKPKQ